MADLGNIDSRNYSTFYNVADTGLVGGLGQLYFFRRHPAQDRSLVPISLGSAVTLALDQSTKTPVLTAVYPEYLPAAAAVQVPMTYEVKGVVVQRSGGVDTPVPYCRVRLYHRQNGVAVSSAMTDAVGQFVFPNLPQRSEAFFAVAFDPDGAPSQNALVFDKLTPVPMA